MTDQNLSPLLHDLSLDSPLSRPCAIIVDDDTIPDEPQSGLDHLRPTPALPPRSLPPQIALHPDDQNPRRRDLRIRSPLVVGVARRMQRRPSPPQSRDTTPEPKQKQKLKPKLKLKRKPRRRHHRHHRNKKLKERRKTDRKREKYRTPGRQRSGKRGGRRVRGGKKKRNGPVHQRQRSWFSRFSLIKPKRRQTKRQKQIVETETETETENVNVNVNDSEYENENEDEVREEEGEVLQSERSAGMEQKTRWSRVEFEKEILGSGATAHVQKGRYWDGEAAVKIFHLSRIANPNSETGFTMWDSEEPDREIRLVQTLRHPHIVAYLGYARSREGNRLAMIMELGKEGDLGKFAHDSIMRDCIVPSLRQRLKWIQGIHSAVAYLHCQKRIVHRDLKLINIVVGADLTAKLCDFGMSEKMDARGGKPLLGTAGYRSPEVMNPRLGPIGAPSDVFALSIIAFQLLTMMITNPYALSLKMRSLSQAAEKSRNQRSGRPDATLSDFGLPVGVFPQQRHVPYLRYLNRQHNMLGDGICRQVANDPELRPVFPASNLWDDTGDPENRSPLWKVRTLIERGWAHHPENRPDARDLVDAVAQAIASIPADVLDEEERIDIMVEYQTLISRFPLPSPSGGYTISGDLSPDPCPLPPPRRSPSNVDGHQVMLEPASPGMVVPSRADEIAALKEFRATLARRTVVPEVGPSRVPLKPKVVVPPAAPLVTFSTLLDAFSRFDEIHARKQALLTFNEVEESSSWATGSSIGTSSAMTDDDEDFVTGADGVLLGEDSSSDVEEIEISLSDSEETEEDEGSFREEEEEWDIQEGDKEMIPFSV